MSWSIEAKNQRFQRTQFCLPVNCAETSRASRLTRKIDSLARRSLSLSDQSSTLERKMGFKMVRDAYNRPVKDLRISVTDRCNFRCTYCMPLEEYVWIDRQEILSFEEITRLRSEERRVGKECRAGRA